VYPGTRLGPYEISARIGAGGMGEVYRARDTKLDRDVALKVLPPQVAADPERIARFEREAKTLAALNHQHIAAIYGVEESDGARALVMELVDGDTLADRIARGPIPLDEMVAIARQIAEALEAAHEQGIVHRDLKPANIKVRADGMVKVLDFGLAKLAERGPAESGHDVHDSPTITSPALMTGVGVLLGTAAYMSPEQASGKTADRRADIWSFGAVLFEMCAGRRAFAGDSTSDALASVLKLDPDWKALPATTPASIRTLIERCLTKDRRLRLQAIGEARIALERPTREMDVTRRPTRIPLVWAGLATVFATVALGLAVVHFRERPSSSDPVRFQIALPENATYPGFPPAAISPDGRQLAYFAAGSDGKRRMWVRTLDSLETKPLAGSEVESFAMPFWSPDSRYIAFAADGKLKKIAVAGGPAIFVCEIPPGPAPGGTWNQDDVILFTSTASVISGEISRVSAAGGVPSPVVRQGIFPVFLPDGKHFLYLGRGSQGGGLYVGSIDVEPQAQDSRRLLASAFAPVYGRSSDGSGYVLFPREGTLLAQPIDAQRLQLTGEPVPVAEQVGANGVLGAFSASANGTLMYVSGATGSRALWFDRQGKILGDAGEGGIQIALSPDGTRAATISSRSVSSDGGSNLWLLDVSRATRTRFTFGSGVDEGAVWSPDGSRIVFASARGDRIDLFQKAASGAGEERPLFESDEPKSPTSWSSDGRYLLFTSLNAKTKNDVWVLPPDGKGKPSPILHTPFNETHAFFSPDGQWLAYISDESGKNEAYVRRFVLSPSGEASPDEGRSLVSTNGAESVRWRRDGRELFYERPDGTIMSVVVATGPSFQANPPQPLFATNAIVGARYWEPTADGQRFLVGVLGGRTTPTPFTVVLNWTEDLKRERR